MSLIQDALKRQQEEMNKKAAATAPASPSDPAALSASEGPLPAAPQTKIPLRMMGQPLVPPKTEPASPVPAMAPFQPPPLPPVQETTETYPEKAEQGVVDRNEPETEKRGPLMLIMAFALLLLLLGGGLYWSWPRLMGYLAPKPPQLAAAGTPESTNAPLPAASSSSVAMVTATVQTSDVTNDPFAESIDTNAPPPDLLGIPEVQDAPPVLYTATPVKAAPALPVIWPAIKVTGMVKLGNTAAALINGHVVEPGETMEGVTLISVNKDGAQLSYEGEERLLRVGETAR